MRKIHTWCLSLVVSAALASVASADSIGYNFVDNWPSPTIGGETADGFSEWTDSIDTTTAQGTGAPNSTDAGAITTPVNAPDVTVSWASVNLWSAGDETNPEQGLYRMYLDDTDNTMSVTVSGLSAWLDATGYVDYEVRLYRTSDAGGGGFTSVDIIDTGTTGILETLPEIALGAAQGDGSWPTGTGGSGTRDVQNSVGTFTADSILFDPADRAGDIRGNISGFMISGVTLVPEPSTAILLGLGALLLVLRRRR